MRSKASPGAALEPVRLDEGRPARQARRRRSPRRATGPPARVDRRHPGERERRASARAIAPLPVPRSRMRPGGGRAPGRDRLHEELGLGPRDERPAVRLQPQPGEFREAEDVLQRLPPAPPADQLADGRQLGVADGALELQVEAHPREPERVADEELRVQPGRLDPLRGEEFGGLLDDLEDGEHGRLFRQGVPGALSRARPTAFTSSYERPSRAASRSS
jgi:hypothetical protein